jgi:hypothetical protein
MFVLVVFDCRFLKSAGERISWQATKTKIGDYANREFRPPQGVVSPKMPVSRLYPSWKGGLSAAKVFNF